MILFVPIFTIEPDPIFYEIGGSTTVYAEQDSKLFHDWEQATTIFNGIPDGIKSPPEKIKMPFEERATGLVLR